MGRQYLIVENAASHLAQYVQDALQTPCSARLISIDQLAQTPVVKGTEMGALIVPHMPGLDQSRTETAIARLKQGGVHLSVLAITPDTAGANEVELGAIYDNVVSMDWTSTPAKIKSFVLLQNRALHDRAFRAFLDNSVDGYWIWDIHADVIEWSQRICEMTGIPTHNSPVDMASFVELIHPQDLDRLQQAINNHFQDGSPYRDIELRLRGGDGTYGSYLVNGQALRKEGGEPIILVGSLTDRSMLRRVEQQLEDTQKRFTVLFHRMNDAAVLADIETGLILEANEPAERLWGRSIAELVGSHQTSLHPPALSVEAIKAFKDHIAALQKNNRATIEVPSLRKDGTLVPTEISSSIIEIGGKPMILGVFRDITDRVRAEAEIRERDAQIQMSSHLASMGTLAAGVAHEINNPLTYVIGNIEFVAGEVSGHPECSPEIKKALEAANTGASYLREIVMDLKAISRMDAAESECDPGEVIRIATRMAMSDLRHRARLDLDLREVGLVPLSSARLSQVILNVLSNAARSFASTDQRKNQIKVSLTRCATHVALQVADNGTGISPEDLKRVCEPFFSRNKQTGGTGLGLSICRRILQEVGGTLSLESTLGLGTTVTITIPAVVSEEEVVPVYMEPPKASDIRKKVLIVDDDQLVSQMIEQVVRKDYDAVVFNDPTAALDHLRSGAAYDGVLCDLMMPGLDGPQLYEAAQRLPQGCPPFLFITGGGVTEGSIALEHRMAELGKLLFKPFKGDALRAKVAEIIHAGGNAKAAPVAKPATSLKIDPTILGELEDLLGHDRLTVQYQRMLADLTEAIAEMDQLQALGSYAEITQKAHKVAGGASVLGLVELAAVLRACQESSMAARSADVALQLASLPALHSQLAQFVQRREALVTT